MKTTILDEDIPVVESALVTRLRECVTDYEKGNKDYSNDLAIAGLLRTLEAIGRPYSAEWSRDLSKTVVTACE